MKTTDNPRGDKFSADDYFAAMKRRQKRNEIKSSTEFILAFFFAIVVCAIAVSAIAMFICFCVFASLSSDTP